MDLCYHGIMSEIVALDLNGLGNGVLRESEEWLIDKQRKSGIAVINTNINWRSSETAPQLRYRIAEQASNLLLPMSEIGKLVLSCRSAGVHLGLAVAELLNDPRVFVLGHSGRVRAGDLSPLDPRTMERCAHLGTSEESLSFYEGVTYCEAETIPNMTQELKDRTLLTTPFGGIDEIVPGITMPIDGVRNIVLPTALHLPTIGLGMYLMPQLVSRLTHQGIQS